MKTADKASARMAEPFLALILIAAMQCFAVAAPLAFDETFDGPGLDALWNQLGNAANHPAVIAGTYDMTHANGDLSTKLTRSTPGTLSSYTHEIEVTLDPFLLSGGGGVFSDFKVKSFGPDGFLEFILNSFGDLRMWHNNIPAGVAGNLQGNTNIGYTDGDLLKLTTNYDQGTDTIDVTYSLNGGAPLPYYSGPGNGGSIGNVITNFVEADLIQWGDQATASPAASIDRWSLSVVEIPEPASALLLAVGGLGLVGYRRR